MTLRLSYSAISEFQLCQRKFYLNRVAGYRPVGPEPRPLAFGNAFHAGQQAWWAGRHNDDPGARLAAAQAAFAQSAELSGLNLADQILGGLLLTGYGAIYADQGLMFHAQPVVEERVVAPVLNPQGRPDPDLEVVAVFDAVCYDEAGRTVVIEHKTTKSLLDDGSRYWERTDPNMQVSLYYIVAGDLGRTVGRFVWDAVRAPEYTLHTATPPEKREFYKRSGTWGKVGDPKPGTRLSDESPDEFAENIRNAIFADPGAFFVRRDLTRTPDELERTRSDLWTVGQQMLRARDTGQYPRNPQSCNAFNTPCAFQPVCWRGESVENPRLYTIRPPRDPFEK